MTHSVFGIFKDRIQAEDAINELEEKGYNPKDMSIVLRDTAAAEEIENNTGANVAGGTASGAATGAVLGGLAGLVAAFAIPGLGAFLIGGPIAAALGLTGAAASTVSGAATGAVAGGLVGALASLGLSNEEAQVYEERVKEGGILVIVPVIGDNKNDVTNALEKHGASDIRAAVNR